MTVGTGEGDLQSQYTLFRGEGQQPPDAMADVMEMTDLADSSGHGTNVARTSSTTALVDTTLDHDRRGSLAHQQPGYASMGEFYHEQRALFITWVRSLGFFKDEHHPYHHKKIINSIRQLRQSEVFAFYPFNLIVYLKGKLWSNGGLFLVLLPYLIGLSALLAIWALRLASTCAGTLIPLFDVPTECHYLILNQTHPSVAQEVRYDDVCSNNLEDWRLTVSFPLCNGTQEMIAQGMEIQRLLTVNSAVAIMIGLVSLYFLTFIMRFRGYFLPKTPRGVIASLTQGFQKGTLMVSYSWTNETLNIARSIANVFPNGLCWIDVKNILPGASIRDICSTAASRADAAFVFITPEYLQSFNCSLELLNLEPATVDVLCRFNGWINDSERVYSKSARTSRYSAALPTISLKSASVPAHVPSTETTATLTSSRGGDEDDGDEANADADGGDYNPFDSANEAEPHHLSVGSSMSAEVHDTATVLRNRKRLGTGTWGDGIRSENEELLADLALDKSNADASADAVADREIDDVEPEILVSSVMKRRRKPARLIVIVTDEVEDQSSLDDETYQFHQDLLQVLRDRGHYILYERNNALQFFAYNIHRMVLETLVLSRALNQIMKNQEITPAVNENWHACAAAVVKTFHLAKIYMLPVMSGIIQVIFASRLYYNNNSNEQERYANSIITALLSAEAAFLVWMGFSLKGSRMWFVHLYAVILFPFYKWIIYSKKFSGLPDTAHLLTLLHSLGVAKQMKVYSSPTAPSYFLKALKILNYFKVIVLVDQYEGPDFSFVCLDGKREGERSRIFFTKTEYYLQVPPVLDDSGCTMYWTRSSYLKVAEHNPKNIKTAFIKCGAAPKIETILVQMLKLALGLPLRASLTTGRKDFKHIDFEVTSAKQRLARRFKKTHVLANLAKYTKDKVTQHAQMLHMERFVKCEDTGNASKAVAKDALDSQEEATPIDSQAEAPEQEKLEEPSDTEEGRQRSGSSSVTLAPPSFDEPDASET